jgi:hypothetical protein
MDSIDIFASIFALLFITYLVIEQGTECAQKVWNRAKETLDEIDLFEAAHVPYASNVETILIFVALTLRSLYRLPIDLFKEFKKLPWEKTPEMRTLNRQLSLGSDILGAVASMLSGFPERASHVFWKERGSRLCAEYEAYRRDYEALFGSDNQSRA